MDIDKHFSEQQQYINENPPSCIAECPIHLEVNELIKEIRKENFEGAYKILKKKIPLTNIIARICDHPCENACITYCEGKQISIHELEKAAVLYGSSAELITHPLPVNNKKIAIIGSGISGLSCAYELNQKGYHVTVFEKNNVSGGSLLMIPENIMDQKTIKKELDQLKELGIEFILNQYVSSDMLKDMLKEYDAIFIGTCLWQDELYYNNVTLQTKNEKIFVGGRIVIGCNSVIQSVYTGQCAAVSIDRFVHNKSLTAYRDKEGTYESNLTATFNCKKILPRIIPESNTFSKKEAIKEAERCFQCDCHKI